MGKGGKKRGRDVRKSMDENSHGDEPESKSRSQVDKRDEISFRMGFPDLKKVNEKFLRFYTEIQEIVDKDEIPEFLEYCRRPLCTTFRINRMNGDPDRLIAELQGEKWKFISNVSNPNDIDKECKIQSPSPLPWYPGNLGWRIDVTRQQMRKISELKPLHKYLTLLDQSGQINRQEAVSMIPPLLLDIKPDDVILDACAAPGSKTAQLLDQLHDSAAPASGLVVGNDANYKRAYMLVHQVSRLASPCFLALNHEGQNIPNLFKRIDSGEIERMLFDRILCDVPCSGDGTIRKNPDIWVKWTPQASIGLHRVQLQIAQRALCLLKPGGRIVYSTCSMSPIEDEAVVAQLLREGQGRIKLVNTSEMLPGLRRKNGLSRWKVQDKAGNVYCSHDDVPEELRLVLRESLFCPSVEEASQMNLERCIRVLPHQQDSGGFFIALLEKTSDFTNPDTEFENIEDDAPKDINTEVQLEDDEISKSGDEEVHESKAKQTRVKGKHVVQYEEPFVQLVENENGKMVADQLVEFFGIQGGFPIELLYTRSSDMDSKQYKIYFVSSRLADVIGALNDDRIPQFRRKLHLVHSGIRIFEKTATHISMPCVFRITQPALNLVLPYITKQILKFPKDLFERLLVDRTLKLDEDLDQETREGVQTLQLGCVVLYLQLQPFPLALTAWYTPKTLTLMVKKDIAAIILASAQHFFSSNST